MNAVTCCPGDGRYSESVRFAEVITVSGNRGTIPEMFHKDEEALLTLLNWEEDIPLMLDLLVFHIQFGIFSVNVVTLLPHFLFLCSSLCIIDQVYLCIAESISLLH